MRALGRWRPALAALAVAAAGCRGTPIDAQRPDELGRLVDSLRPAVERATGLPFKGPVRAAMRDREEVRSYLLAKLAEQLPPARVRGVTAAYRLFGLVPDTLDLQRLLLDLYAEQVAGFYEPDSTMLFGVRGADPAQLRLVVAHELVHALQHQYVPLDSILDQRDDNDRLSAAQAILEGQATLASIAAITPGQDLAADPAFWETFREQVQAQQASMAVFAQAPLVLREGLLFPYLAGSEWLRWWRGSHQPGEMPFGSRMPLSTEQVLFPNRYAGGDAPLALRFDGPAPAHEDVLGELGLRVLDAAVHGAAAVRSLAPNGWGGDRFALYDGAAGPALVWYAVWDTDAARARFLDRVGTPLRARQRPGYRSEVTSLDVGGRPATRWVFAPPAWDGWRSVPGVRPVP